MKDMKLVARAKLEDFKTAQQLFGHRKGLIFIKLCVDGAAGSVMGKCDTFST